MIETLVLCRLFLFLAKFNPITHLSYGSEHIYGVGFNQQDMVAFHRDDLHREIACHYANGISQEQHHDTMGRLIQQNIVNGHEFGYPSNEQVSQPQNNAIQETQQLIQRLYQYDKTGQLTGINDTHRGISIINMTRLGVCLRLVVS